MSFTVKLTDGESETPITGHTVNFYAWKVVYYAWDDQAGEYVQEEEVISSENGYDLTGFSDFSPDSTSDTGGSGVYETAQIVYEDDEDFLWYVDEVYFWAIDKTVYF